MKSTYGLEAQLLGGTKGSLEVSALACIGDTCGGGLDEVVVVAETRVVRG
jgi:hypothetical protein